MNILIVYCHPSEKSYTFEILQLLKELFYSENWNVEVSDLYRLNFKSDLSVTEYEREAFSKIVIPIPEDVLLEHHKIQNADCILFLYPLWWSDCPAKLKGWFDRVFTVGFAYKHSEVVPKMKEIPYGVALCTAGHPTSLLEETGISQSMKNIMLNDRFGNRFNTKEMIILGGTTSFCNELQLVHRELILQLIDKIKQQFV
ncbi:NAD(P)H-dependent oxidoreductase [Flavobacterium adhaerens]|uniref:NAD(P)H-dependent oxidoreductase n=1 Tax=Flavobacterium adhaerens TaxID=3149043 RepID=UPI0032B5F2AD